MNNLMAIFKKQLKDTLKNKTVLIQFLMFPLLTILMNNAIQLEYMPSHYFINLFATMYIGMAPLTSMAAILAEEKEKNTLRVLFLSNVKSYEYLIGIGSYVWIACMIGSSLICWTANYDLRNSFLFMSIMAIGIFVSILVGAAIGTWSKSQMMATSLSVPVMIILAFIPMLSMFNSTISKYAKYLYSEQISLTLTQMQLHFESILIIGINIVITEVIFMIAYKKSHLFK